MSSGMRRRRNEDIVSSSIQEGSQSRCKPQELVELSRRKNSARRRRRNCTRVGARKFIYLGSFALVIAELLGTNGARAQFSDGGAIAMDCGPCSCEGTSDDGSIQVFDNPSSGERIVSVDGEHAGILDTSCGSSIIAVGSTVYELSGIGDLATRTLEVLDMTSSECVTDDTPSTADCYRGTTEVSDLADGLDMEIIFDYGTWEDGVILFKSNVKLIVGGAEEVFAVIEEFCLDFGFVSQLFTATIGGTDYLYNLDFSTPGNPSSADLSVASAPPTSAGAFVCGELSPTPSPMELVAPTGSPVDAASPAPVEPDTPAPIPPPPTSLPVSAPTSQPAAALTSAPVGVTPAPLGDVAATPAPVVETIAPPPVSAGTPAPSQGAVATSGPSAAENLTTMPTPAPSTSATSSQVETLAPVDRAELEEFACILPESGSCTLKTSVLDTNSGVGSYYDLACNTTLADEGSVPGCDTSVSLLCRTCFFNTRLYQELNPEEELPPHVDCPCCVLDIYEKTNATNEDGARCEDVTPAPSQITPSPSAGPLDSDARGIGANAFEDKGLRMNGGEGVALVALGLFAALTFLPLCSK